MIFAVETEERTLIAFASESEAVAYCEGLDVEAAVWLFWNDRGQPLEPQFTVPNKRGFLFTRNGSYTLTLASPNHHATLTEALDNIRTFESPAPFNSASGVRSYLESGDAA